MLKEFSQHPYCDGHALVRLGPMGACFSDASQAHFQSLALKPDEVVVPHCQAGLQGGEVLLDR